VFSIRRRIYRKNPYKSRKRRRRRQRKYKKPNYRSRKMKNNSKKSPLEIRKETEELIEKIRKEQN